MDSLQGRRVLYGIGGLFIALLIFHAGLVAGSHRHMRGEKHGWHGFTMEGHGTVGIVQDVASSSIRIQTRDGLSQIVRLTPTTQVRADDASSTIPASGQYVTVLGVPNDDGTLSATLIHIGRGHDTQRR